MDTIWKLYTFKGSQYVFQKKTLCLILIYSCLGRLMFAKNGAVSSLCFFLCTLHSIKLYKKRPRIDQLKNHFFTNFCFIFSVSWPTTLHLNTERRTGNPSSFLLSSSTEVYSSSSSLIYRSSHSFRQTAWSNGTTSGKMGPQMSKKQTALLLNSLVFDLMWL